MPVIPVNNRNVHIQEWNKGAAETVVLVHGMFSNLSIYYFSIAPLLAKAFHVVLYDLKSHGKSERVATGYDLESMSDDLIALLDALQLDRVNIAGYSFGALIALKTAIRFPERCNKLVLIEAPDPGDDKTRDIIDDYSKDFLVNYINNFTDTTKVKMGNRQLERNHRMYEYLFYQTSLKKDMLLERDFFKREEIRSIAIRTLLLYGNASNCLEAGRFLQRQIPYAGWKELPGDHNVPIQEPELIAQELLDFFNAMAWA